MKNMKMFMYVPHRNIRMFIGVEDEEAGMGVYIFGHPPGDDPDLVAIQVGTLVPSDNDRWREVDSNLLMDTDFYKSVFTVVDYKSWRRDDPTNPFNQDV